MICNLLSVVEYFRQTASIVTASWFTYLQQAEGRFRSSQSDESNMRWRPNDDNSLYICQCTLSVGRCDCSFIEAVSASHADHRLISSRDCQSARHSNASVALALSSTHALDQGQWRRAAARTDRRGQAVETPQLFAGTMEEVRRVLRRGVAVQRYTRPSRDSLHSCQPFFTTQCQTQQTKWQRINEKVPLAQNGYKSIVWGKIQQWHISCT